MLPCYEGRADCAMNIHGKCEALMNMDFDGKCPFYKDRRELPMYETDLMFYKAGCEVWGDTKRRSCYKRKGAEA